MSVWSECLCLEGIGFRVASACCTVQCCVLMGSEARGSAADVIEARHNDVGPLVDDRDEEESRTQNRNQQEGPQEHPVQNLGNKLPVLDHLRTEEDSDEHPQVLRTPR